MTEQEWLACADPKPMLDFLRRGIIALVDELPTPESRETMRRTLEGTIVTRKLRLFACACCRHIWTLLTDERSRKAVEVTEQFIDGFAGDDEFQVAGLASLDARNAVKPNRNNREEAHIHRIAANAVWETARSEIATAAQESAEAATWAGRASTLSEAATYQPLLLRCIFGNPFRPTRPDPAWLAWNGGTAVKLARAIYDERAFDRLPILADALEEAGCTDADILSHCRGEGPHVRGCWVVDLILGKQ
jgi:hypothetical protein